MSIGYVLSVKHLGAREENKYVESWEYEPNWTGDRDTLKDVFKDFQWDAITHLNTVTNRRIHDGNIPTSSTGRPIVIVPDPGEDPDTAAKNLANMLRSKTKKRGLVFEDARFEVKLEEDPSSD
jgi:hypothetical protein